MTEQDKAQKLAEWLATPAGTPPPEDLDPEVLAAVVALRPDRAPAPRVSFDDIVGSVQSGPFVAANNNVAMPPVTNRRRGWFMVFVSSGAFAAAAVGLIFVPIAYNVLSSRMTSMEKVAPAEEAAPAAAPAPAPGGGVPEMQAARTPAADAPTEPTVSPQLAAAPTDADKGAAERREVGLTDAPAEEKAAAAGPAPVVSQAPAPPPPAQDQAIAEAAPARGEDETNDMLRSLGYVDAAPEPAKPAPKAPATEAAPAPASTMATGASTPTAGKAAAKSKAYAEDEEADVSTADDAKKESSRLKKDAADDVWAARSAAVPSDYSSSWYTKYPDVAAAYARGDFESLVNDSRADVAMDAAWRAATAWRAGGDSGRAMATVQAALRKSKANTVFRSNLLLLQGDLYTESDRFSSATEAWTEAARLNRAR